MRLPVSFACVATLVACGTTAPPSNVLECDAISGVVACNSFEAVDPAWTTLVDRGAVVLDDPDAADGDQAMRATVAVGGGKAALTRGIAVADHYYARFYANVPAGADTSGLALLHLGETAAPFLGTNVEIAGGMLGVAVQSADVYAYLAPMPLGRWVCLDFELTVSDTAGHVTLYADRALVVDRDGLDTRPAAGIGDLEVGLAYVAPEATNGTTALIDDVVIAREPLAPCPTP